MGGRRLHRGGAARVSKRGLPPADDQSELDAAGDSLADLPRQASERGCVDSMAGTAGEDLTAQLENHTAAGSFRGREFSPWRTLAKRCTTIFSPCVEIA